MGVLNLMLVNADHDPKVLIGQLDHNTTMNRDITFFIPEREEYQIGSATHIKTSSHRRGGDRIYDFSDHPTFDWWINIDACICLGQRMVT